MHANRAAKAFFDIRINLCDKLLGLLLGTNLRKMQDCVLVFISVCFSVVFLVNFKIDIHYSLYVYIYQIRRLFYDAKIQNFSILQH